MAENFVSLKDDKSLVSGVEIHFLFPFSCPKSEEFKPNPNVWEEIDEAHWQGSVDRLFGDDGHLKFRGPKTFTPNDLSAFSETFRGTTRGTEEVYEYKMNQVRRI